MFGLKKSLLHAELNYPEYTYNSQLLLNRKEKTNTRFNSLIIHNN